MEQQAYSNVELTRTTPHKVLAVPLAALNDNRQYVFVATADNKLERRKISVGSDDGKYAEVFSGLKEGETVITSATKGLTEDTKVTVTLSEDKN